MSEQGLLEGAVRPDADDVLYRGAETESRLGNGVDLLLRSRTQNHDLRLVGALRDLWDLLDYPMRQAELVEALRGRFAAPLGAIEAGVGKGLRLLAEHGLLETSAIPTGPGAKLRDRYLRMLKRGLVNLPYVEHDMRLRLLLDGGVEETGKDLARVLRDIRSRRPEEYEVWLNGRYSAANTRLMFSHTLSGLFQLTSAERCAERIFADGVPGDFMECGVCQGGFSIFLRGVQVAHGESQRRMWLADTFGGAPPPQSELDRVDHINLQEKSAPWAAFGLDAVQENFRRYDLASPAVGFLEGPLHETLPGETRIGPLALLRIDTDFHSSMMVALEELYDRVSPGGYVIIDDYGLLDGVRQAIDEFRASRGVTAPLQRAEPVGVFWRKPG